MSNEEELRMQVAWLKQENRYWYGQANRKYEDMRKGHECNAVRDIYALLCERCNHRELTFDDFEAVMNDYIRAREEP